MDLKTLPAKSANMQVATRCRSALATDMDHLPFSLYSRRSPKNGTPLPDLELLDRSAMPWVLDTAERGFTQWQAFGPEARGDIFTKAAANLKNSLLVDAERLGAETAKSESEAQGELERAIQTFEWHAEHARQLAISPNRLEVEACHLEAEPLGVALAIVPWNYPAVIGARKICAMLLAGCSVIVKASEIACSPLFAFRNALASAGLPPETLSIILGKGEEVVPSLVASNRVHAVSFTGSSTIGRQISELAGQHLIKCVTELGANAPVIVLEGSDVDKTVQAVVDYKFELAGQSCNAPDRVFIPSAMWSEFQQAFTLRVQQLNGPECMLSPMISRQRAEEMQSLVEDALAHGARLLEGGQRSSPQDNHFPATLIADVPPAARIRREEIFGPVLALIPYNSLENAIAQANDSEYGFASYVFGPDRQATMKTARALNSGYVVLNGLSGVHPALPVGGIRMSGNGLEGGEMGVREFMRWRLFRDHTC
ncbi:aldehyde dehydrogenase family protein [Pseudomonas aeruginosa]|nr:aldehyde dehydrogenase family protein [Pseudomonas aeruginosa]